jgi:hypothetical protein
VLVVDTAHGHAQGVLDRVKWIKKPIPRCRSSAATSAPPTARGRSSITAPTA